MILVLSDGTEMDVPDGASEEAIRNFSARGEAFIKSNAQRGDAAYSAETGEPARPMPPQDASYQAGAQPTDNDPYSLYNTGGRWLRNVISAVPDTAIMGANIIGAPGRFIGNAIADQIPGSGPQVGPIPTVSEIYSRKLGVPDLPADASWPRRIGEGVAASAPFALAGGAVNAANAGRGVLGTAGTMAKDFVVNSVLPTITSDAGARGGGALGAKIGGAIAGDRGAEIGREYGTQAGGVLGGFLPQGAGVLGRERVRQYYANRASPNAPEIAAAAERQGITPTAGMLGNTDVKAAERNALGLKGSFSQEARTNVQQQILDRARQAAAAEGATGADVPSSGQTIRDIATARSNAMQGAESARQEALMHEIGPRTPANVRPILEDIARIRGETDPATFEPIKQRGEGIWKMLREEQPGVPDTQLRPELPYGRLKDWRTNVDNRYQNLDRVPGRYAQQLRESATSGMEGAAMSRGVPPQRFADTQTAYANMLRDVEALAPYADPVATASNIATRLLPKGASIDPTRIQEFARIAADPRVRRVFADYLNQIIDRTIGVGGADATGRAQSFRQFADQIRGPTGIPDAALPTLAPTQAPTFRDLSTLAGAVDYPTQQGGATRMLAGQAGNTALKWLGTGLGAGVGAATSNPWLGGIVGGAVGRGAGTAVPYIADYIRQGPTARAGLSGQPLPARPQTMAELLAAITAAQAAQREARP